MITRLVVSNYRSLGRDVEIPLGQLTVLVGTNGSGKSNAVDVLRFVADCMKVGLESAIHHRLGISEVRRWSSGKPYDMSIELSASWAILQAHNRPARAHPADPL